MAIMFGDPATGISSNIYIGRWWGEPTMLRQMLVFCLPDGRALFAKNYGRSPEGQLPSAAGLVMRPLEDGRIHCTFDGPMDLRRQSDYATHGLTSGPTVRVTIEMHFHSDFPIWDLHATDTDHDVKKNLMFPSGHMEQLGFVSGTLRFADEEYRIDKAPTVRDHSRGVRDWRTHQSHVWFNGQFPSGWGFCAFRAAIVGQEGHAMNSAALFRDGKVYPATIETDGLIVPGMDVRQPFTITLIPDGLDPIRIDVTGMFNHYVLGMHDPADLNWGVPSDPDDPATTWSNEQSAQLRCGDEIGYGHVERCNREVKLDDRWRAMFADDRLLRLDA
jgi:hypothetical protein